MTYSYAFGDHTLFLRKDVWSHITLMQAFNAPGPGALIYVYDGNILVGVFGFPDLLNRVVKKKRYPQSLSRFLLMQRYVRRYARYQSA